MEDNTVADYGHAKRVCELMKDDLGEKIMIKFVRLSPKSNSYLIDVCSEGKKKDTKKCFIKKTLNLKVIKSNLKSNSTW